MSRNRMRLGVRRSREGKGARPGARLAGLRWVPLPLAILMAALGWLVLGSMLGQHAAANDRAHGLEAGGLGLTVNEMFWMSSAMSGPGQSADMNAPGMSGPGQSNAKGYQMPDSMMPGMQAAGDKRLRIEVYIRNVSTDPQQYALSDFRVVGPGGKSWKIVANRTTQGAAQKAVLEPGFQATVDLYFDIPAGQSQNLSVKWSHGGSTVSFPVHISGTDSTSVMAGMAGM